MFDLRDLFQWERFITPSIIKMFYWLAVGISCPGRTVAASSSGLAHDAAQPGRRPVHGHRQPDRHADRRASFARIVAEFVLIMFRINEHLGAIRNRGQM